jgi:hypothetical protein
MIWRERGPLAAGLGEVEPILRDRVIGIYNADFDMRLIRQSNAAHGIRTGWRTRRLFA